MPLVDDTDPPAPHVPVLPPVPGAWLAPWFQPPGRTELPTGHHLRPLRGADDGLAGLPAGLDCGAAASAASARTSFVYGVFDDEERSLLAWVTLDPGATGHDVLVGWAVAPEQVGTPLGDALGDALPAWLARAWPWTAPRITRR